MQAPNKRKTCFSAVIIILVVSPLFSFSQKEGDDELPLLLQLKESKTDADRLHLFLELSQKYLSRADKPGRNLENASYFVAKALYLSQGLKNENGENEKLVNDNFSVDKKELRSALNLLGTLQDSALCRLLLILSKYYLFKKDRSKSDIDSSFLLLDQANKIVTNSLPEKWQNESLHARSVFYFRTGDIQQGKKLFKELIGKVSKPGDEESEAVCWHELALLIRSGDTTEITRLYCLEKMRSLYKKTGNQEKETEALKCIADAHLVRGRLDLAEAELLEVLQRYKTGGYPRIYSIYDLLGVTYRNKGDFSKAIFYGLKTIESIENRNDIASPNTFYSRLANMYRELGQPEKSVEWYRKMFRKQEFTVRVNQYMFRDAGFLARELIKLKKQNEALSFILDIKAKNKPFGVHAEASLLASLAYCYRAVMQYHQADEYYFELVKLIDLLEKDNEITIDVYYELGQYFLGNLQYKKAAIYLQDALSAPEGTNSLSVTKDIHLMLYKADSAMGNYLPAIQHLMKHKLLNDSIFNETKSRQIEELQVQYQTVQKQKDIDSLNNRNKLQHISVEQATRTKNITLTGAALLLTIAVLLFNRYIVKQRNNRKLEAHQKELDQKNIFLETLNAEQDKLLQEKEWLIKEVHHRVKNNLQIVMSLLNSQSVYIDNNAALAAIHDSQRRMHAMALIHQKLYQSENISSIAMREYINELVCYLQDSFDTGSRLVFEQTIEPLNLDVSQAIPLGLIINESIVNALKYAFPDECKGIVKINLLNEGPDQLLLEISDNGIGLTPGFDIMQHNSLGLDLMRGLAKQLNGSFAIESNKGLHITVRFITLNKRF